MIFLILHIALSGMKGEKMAKKQIFGIILLILSFFVITNSIAYAQEVEPFALVLNAKGEVILNHNNQLQPAETSTIIFNGDILLTKDNSLAVIRFSDNGAIIKLFSNSTLSVDMNNEAGGLVKKLKLDAGDLWSEVKVGIGTFSAQTPTSVAAVKGTKFLTSVDAQTGYSTIYVFDGTVEFGNDFGMVNVTSGNQGFSNGTEAPTLQPLKTSQIPKEIRKGIEAPVEIREGIPKGEKGIETPEAPAIPEEKGEKPEAKAGPSLPFPMTAGVGSVTMDNQTYSQIRLMPEFTIWKFGLGMDINLLFGSDGKIRKEDWEDFDDYLNKILYVRFAKRDDPFYLRLGSFPKMKFGQGLIMKDYTNMLNYPDQKQLGTEVAVNTKIYDLEFDAFCPNIYDLDIFAGRVKASPLKTLDIPIIKNIQFGATAATDLNQLGGLKDSDKDGYPDKFDDFPDNKAWWADTDGDGWPDTVDVNAGGNPADIDIDANGDNILDTSQNLDSLNLKKVYKLGKKESVTILGADYMVPLLNSKPLQIYHYGEVAKIVDYGWGCIFPGFGSHFLIFDLNLEYRIFGEKFEPNYFNYLYDNERVVIVGDSVVTKESQLDSVKYGSQGWRGELTSHILNFLDLSVAYEDIHGEDYNLGKSVYGQAKLKESFIPKLSYAYARYSQTKVKDFTTWKNPNAFIEAELGYELSPNSLLIANYKEHYEDIDDNGTIEGSEETITSYTVGVQFRF
jgi:hypothetical protein